MPSTPALPLLAFTCRNASFRFSRSPTSSINRSVLAGLSGPLLAPDDSVSSPATPRAAPVSADEKSSRSWIFRCLSSLRLMAYSPLLLVRAFSVTGCRVGGGAPARWPPSAAQTARTVFPYAAFTKTHRRRNAKEGINPTKLTSPYSPYSLVLGSSFQPPLRQRLNRCDQRRRRMQPSSSWKSFR